jgi:hypothetical protein
MLAVHSGGSRNLNGSSQPVFLGGQRKRMPLRYAHRLRDATVNLHFEITCPV